MTRTMSISETGLRLIKAFEGFRPTDRELVTGARVIGYGHRLYSDMPMRMSKSEAEERLKLDLESYEDLINSEVHAPLSQSQFDALVSLAFNIGPKAFRQSDTVRAINNGRVLDAADGFDIWRKARIGDETYVVDALMRRRTAEKALFLRTEGPLHASGAMLEPEPDPDAPTGTSDDDLPTFSREESTGLVRKAGYDSDAELEAEASEDEDTAPDGEDEALLTLSETIAPNVDNAPEADAPAEEDDLEAGLAVPTERDVLKLDSVDLVSDPGTDSEPGEEGEPDADDLEVLPDTDAPMQLTEADVTPSPIAEAADALGERLNKLIDSDDEQEVVTPDLPTSLLTSADDAPSIRADEIEVKRSNLVAFPGRSLTQEETPDVVDDAPSVNMKRDAQGRPVVIDDLAADDAMRAGADANERRILEPDGDAERNAALYLERRNPVKPSGGGLWIPLMIGAVLLGASLALLGRGATALLNGWGPVAVVTAAITGGLMLLFALYAAARGRFA